MQFEGKLLGRSYGKSEWYGCRLKSICKIWHTVLSDKFRNLVWRLVERCRLLTIDFTLLIASGVLTFFILFKTLSVNWNFVYHSKIELHKTASLIGGMFTLHKSSVEKLLTLFQCMLLLHKHDDSIAKYLLLLTFLY